MGWERNSPGGCANCGCVFPKCPSCITASDTLHCTASPTSTTLPDATVTFSTTPPTGYFLNLAQTPGGAWWGPEFNVGSPTVPSFARFRLTCSTVSTGWTLGYQNRNTTGVNGIYNWIMGSNGNTCTPFLLATGTRLTGSSDWTVS